MADLFTKTPMNFPVPTNTWGVKAASTSGNNKKYGVSLTSYQPKKHIKDIIDANAKLVGGNAPIKEEWYSAKQWATMKAHADGGVWRKQFGFYHSPSNVNVAAIKAFDILFQAWYAAGLLQKYVYSVGMRNNGGYGHFNGWAMDINTGQNPGYTCACCGVPPGIMGNVTELVPIAAELGWFWGAWFNGQAKWDNHHFEIYDLEKATKGDIDVTNINNIVYTDTIDDDNTDTIDDDNSDTDVIEDTDDISNEDTQEFFKDLNDYLLTGQDMADSVTDKKDTNKSTVVEEEKPIVVISIPEHMRDVFNFDVS